MLYIQDQRDIRGGIVTGTTSPGGLSSVHTALPVSGNGLLNTPVTIEDGAIQTPKLADGSVTRDKLDPSISTGGIASVATDDSLDGTGLIGDPLSLSNNVIYRDAFLPTIGIGGVAEDANTFALVDGEIHEKIKEQIGMHFETHVTWNEYIDDETDSANTSLL